MHTHHPPDYAADPDAQLNVTATFDPDPAPQNATYLYNAQGQRASKTVNGVTTHFVYSDADGQLLGEYNATGSPIREYMYLEGERVAMYDYTTVEPKDSTNQKSIIYLHNNQVGQVQYAFNSDGQMIYERVQTPFGETMGEINAYDLQMPVRFPGQYYDSETGFNQNWNRDYDPSIGRYLQSDPIGLRGGMNTYGYVGQRPVMWVDPMGLQCVTSECVYSAREAAREAVQQATDAAAAAAGVAGSSYKMDEFEQKEAANDPEYDAGAPSQETKNNRCWVQYVTDLVDCETKCDKGLRAC